MISLEAYKKALGDEVKNLSPQEIEDLKDRQEKLANMLFDMLYYKDSEPRNAKDN